MMGVSLSPTLKCLLVLRLPFSKVYRCTFVSLISSAVFFKQTLPFDGIGVVPVWDNEPTVMEEVDIHDKKYEDFKAA